MAPITRKTHRIRRERGAINMEFAFGVFVGAVIVLVIVLLIDEMSDWIWK